MLAWDPRDRDAARPLSRARAAARRQLWLAQPPAPWQMQVAPAMDRIVKAEAAAMRVTLASLLADVRSPVAAPTPLAPPRRVAERRGAE